MWMRSFIRHRLPDHLQKRPHRGNLDRNHRRFRHLRRIAAAADRCTTPGCRTAPAWRDSQAGLASELQGDFVCAVAQICRGGKRAVAPFIVPPGFALAAPGGGQLLLALPNRGAVARKQDVRFENIGERGMNQRPGLHGIMPVALDAHAGRGVRPRAVSDHRAVGSFAVHAREEDLVIGHAVLGEVKAFSLVRQFIDRKLPLGEHLFPGNDARAGKDAFPKVDLGFRQQARDFEGFACLGDIHLRAKFSFKIRRLGECDQKHPVLNCRVWKRAGAPQARRCFFAKANGNKYVWAA